MDDIVNSAVPPRADPPPVARTTLTRSGLEVSRLGFGLSRLHYLSESDGAALIGTALDLGITHFDAARLYGDGLAERVLGRAIAHRRADVTIATKFGLSGSALIERAGPLAHGLRGARAVLRRVGVAGSPGRTFSAEDMQRSLLASLRALRTDYLDILFVHEPHAAELERADALFRALADRKRAGAIRAVGISAAGADAARIMERYGDAIDVLQVPEPQWEQNGLRPDITFGALSQGPQAFGSAGPGRDAALDAVRRALARRPDGCLLVGTTKPAHLRELAAAGAGR